MVSRIKMGSLVTLLFVSYFSRAQGNMPDCLNMQGQPINVDDQSVLGWKTSTRNGFTARAHIAGTISKIYRDSSGHHHWEATIGANSSDTLEVIYDKAFGSVPTPQIGASVEACGDYITANGGGRPSPDGGLIHWIHRSNSPRHPSGFLVIDGQLYGQNAPGH